MRIASYRILSLLLSTLFVVVGQPPVATSLARGGSPASASLTLNITPASVSVGSVVTLHITYNGVGLVHTTITATPSDVISFDPARSMPCKYDEDPTSCTTFTLRAITPGAVTIHASANGEIYDTDCSCWIFTVVDDAAPAILTITGSRVFLPAVQG